MGLVSTSDDLHNLLDTNKKLIKGEYVNIKLFVDSAVRDKLRRMKVAGVGDDEVIAHLERLKQSKARHIDQQKLAHTQRNHKRRVAHAKKGMDELPTE